MKKILLILLCLAISLSAKEYFIGFKKLNVYFSKTDEKFPLALVYPTSTPSKKVKFGAFEMDLAIGADVAKGKFPLAVISHGSGGSNLAHRSIAFELAKNGYVVAMPLHPKNNYQNNSMAGTLENYINRPLHISVSIDRISKDKSLATSVDFDKLAVIGHSVGGYSALGATGAKGDTKHIIDLCTKLKINAPFCANDKLKSQKILNKKDKRVKALVLLAPVGILFRDKNSLDDVNVPIFMLKAGKDKELKEPYHSDLIAKNYKHKDLLNYCEVANAGHFSFISPFPKSIEKEVGIVAMDPKGFDRVKFHDILSQDIVCFLDRALKGKYDTNFKAKSCNYISK